MPNEFPMRINKYLAHKGHSTRRGADEMIEKGQVFLNGTRAKLGDLVHATDSVEVKRSGKLPSYVYVLFNKPAGINSHPEDGAKGKDAVSMLPPKLRQLKLFPLGRLDKDSEGILILTNDGRATDRLLNPKYEHEKEYVVKTKKPLRNTFKTHMEKGVNIEGYITKPAKVQIMGVDRFRVTITEGKPHQVRRMVAALFNEVASLKRTRIMHLTLGTLKSGEYQVLEGRNKEQFLTSIGL